MLERLSSPLSTTLCSWVPELPDSLLTRLLRTLAWEDRGQWTTNRIYGTPPRIFTSGTRSLCLALDNAESAALSMWTALPVRAVQMKGAVFIPSVVEGRTRVARPDHISPPTGSEFKEHAIFFTDVDEQGLFVGSGHKVDRSEGALVLSVIANERAMTRAGMERGLVAPLAFGFGVFDDLEFKGQQVGFLLLGVYDRWNARLSDFFSTVPYVNPYLSGDNHLIAPHPACAERCGVESDFFAHAAPRQANELMARIHQQLSEYASQLFSLYGAGISRAHARGIVFCNPHFENVLPAGEVLVLHDWEFARDVSAMSEARRVGYCVLDIRNLLNQLFLAITHARETSFELLAHANDLVNLFGEFLRGYGLPPDRARQLGAELFSQCRVTGRCRDRFLQSQLAPEIARVSFA